MLAFLYELNQGVINYTVDERSSSTTDKQIQFLVMKGQSVTTVMPKYLDLCLTKPLDLCDTLQRIQRQRNAEQWKCNKCAIGKIHTVENSTYQKLGTDLRQSQERKMIIITVRIVVTFGRREGELMVMGHIQVHLERLAKVYSLSNMFQWCLPYNNYAIHIFVWLCGFLLVCHTL